MSKILDEVRKISSQKIAEKQKVSENAYPKILEKIKQFAATGVTQCEFSEHVIDQYTKRLLEQDGFSVWATTKIPKQNDYKGIYSQREPESIWIVRW